MIDLFNKVTTTFREPLPHFVDAVVALLEQSNGLSSISLEIGGVVEIVATASRTAGLQVGRHVVVQDADKQLSLSELLLRLMEEPAGVEARLQDLVFTLDLGELVLYAGPAAVMEAVSKVLRAF